MFWVYNLQFKSCILKSITELHVQDSLIILWYIYMCVCVCVCVCGHVYVVYEDTNLYNDMGMT